MKLEAIMDRQVIQIAPTDTIAVAAERMFQAAVGCLVVTASEAIKGIITDRDTLACVAEKHDPYTCPVSAHLRHPVIVLDPDETIATAAEVLRRKHIKRLPVVRKGKLLGIVSLSDLASLASAEAARLGPALDFFTSVVRAQASQHCLPEQPAAEPSEVDCTDAQSANRWPAMPDTGGPG